MKTKLFDENAAAADMLKPEKNDRSGIGGHYVDAYIKSIKNLILDDGTKISCKRRGLKVKLTLGGKKGEGLMRPLEISRDPVVMLEAALKEAAGKIAVQIVREEGKIFIERP
jgi:hypothetical protein